MRWNTKQSIYYYASSLYMFRVPITPIIMSTQNCNYSLRHWPFFFFCSYLLPTCPSYSCAPDDGCGWHPKHVELTRIIINRLFCVSSHWTIINIMTGLFSSCHSKYLTLIFQPVKWNVSDLHFPVKINWNFGQDFVTVFWRFCGSERGNQTVCKLSRAN